MSVVEMTFAMKGYVYILECSNGLFYTGSTKDLDKRLAEHQAGRGANFTKKHLPVTLVYFEEYSHISNAFEREKQIQGWSRSKKQALINGTPELLPELSECQNGTHHSNYSKQVPSTPLRDPDESKNYPN